MPCYPLHFLWWSRSILSLLLFGKYINTDIFSLFSRPLVSSCAPSDGGDDGGCPLPVQGKGSQPNPGASGPAASGGVWWTFESVRDTEKIRWLSRTVTDHIIAPMVRFRTDRPPRPPRPVLVIDPIFVRRSFLFLWCRWRRWVKFLFRRDFFPFRRTFFTA